MGWSFRKSIRLGKGLRINLSRRGIGWSVGGKLLRMAFSRGRTRISSGVGPFRYEKSLSNSPKTSGGGSGCLIMVLGVCALGLIGSLLPSSKNAPKQPAGKSVTTEKTETERSPVPPQSTVKATQSKATEISIVEVKPPTVASPRPVPTGHAADAAKWRAVAIYPRLGIADSPLNKAFIQRVRRYQSEKPQVFDNPEWPTVIARECASE